MDTFKSALKYIVPLIVGIFTGMGIDLGVSPTGECPPCEEVPE